LGHLSNGVQTTLQTVALHGYYHFSVTPENDEPGLRIGLRIDGGILAP
jgi:hypothetical protein